MKRNERKSKMIVDIIVPVYNVERYIDFCVESLLNQTYKNIQIILVDDGSTDSSGDICEKYMKKNSNVSVFHKENGGLVSAWTYGVARSQNEWIVFVDGDDWIEPRHIEGLVKEQQKSNADVVVTRMKQVEKEKEHYIPFEVEAGVYSGKKLENSLYPVMIHAGFFEKRGVPFSRCSKLIKKSILISNLKYLYENATYEEDFNIMAPLLMDVKTISLLKTEDAAYCYRRVESSMLHGYDRNMNNSINNIYPRLLAACEEKGKKIFENQIMSEYVTACIRQFTNELKNSKGFFVANRNISYISEQKFFVEGCQLVSYKEFPVRFKIIYFILKHYKWKISRGVTRILYFLRSQK